MTHAVEYLEEPLQPRDAASVINERLLDLLVESGESC